MQDHDETWYLEHVHNISRYFVENRQISWVLLLLSAVFGIFGYVSMPQSKDPNVPIKSAMVIYEWKGQAPEKIEQLVTRKIEEALSQNEAVKKIESTVRVGQTFITVELKPETPAASVDKELDDIKIRLDSIQGLPQSSGPLTYIKDFGSTAALMMTVASPKNGEIANEILSKSIVATLTEIRGASPVVSGHRASVMAVLPLSVDPHTVHALTALWVRRATAEGIIRNPVQFERPGFGGVDFETSLNDRELTDHATQILQQEIVPSEVPQDASPPLIVSDLKGVKALLSQFGSDKYSYREMEHYSDLLRRTLQQVQAVSKVTRSGVLDEEIDVTYSQARLASFKLNATQIQKTLQSQNVPNIGGAMENDGRLLDVEPTGDFRNIDKIKNVIIGKSSSGSPIYLRDFADVSRGYKTPADLLNFLDWRDAQGHMHRSRAVTLAVEMRPGLKIQDFASRVDQALSEAKILLPADLILDKTSDQPRQVEENIHLFNESLYEAIGIIILISMIGFWQWRAALLLALSIPVTLLLTYGFMHTLGLDLQQVSIASLIIALGLLVDSPVVASDAIERAMSQGESKQISSWVGPTRLRRAVLFATIANVAAYLPFLLLTGSMGEFIFSLPIVMTITLCSSLLVTWTFLPLFSFYILKVPKKIKKPSADSNRGFIRYYRSIVRLAIHHRKWVLAGASIVLLLGFYLGSTLKASFFPEDLSQFSYADIWLPQDVATSSTSQKAEQVGGVIKREASRYETEILGKKWIKKHPEGLLKMLDTFVGTGSPRFWYSLAPQAPQKNYAQIVMELSDKWQTESFLAFCQKAVDAEIAGARVDMRQLEAGSSVGVPISLRVSGEDIPTLRKIASKVQAVIAADPKARHVFQDWGNDRFFVQLNVDSDRAALSGLTHEDIANAFSTSLDGLTMTYLREGDKQIPVVSKLAMQERTSPSSLDSFYVYPSSSGSPVQLGQFSTQTVKMGPAMIYRYNQFRTVQVQAFAAPGSLPSEVLKDIGPAIKKIETELPPGYKIVYGGSIEEQNDSSAPLPMVLGISLISIFMALVFQFKSAIKPFIVFSAIPFGVCGAMLGLWIMKTSFGFMAFLGIISLIGVIVSHIIVLFDFIEGAHDRGEPLEDALLNAGTERLRPVLITVGATVFALLPLSFHGGPLWQSLCYAQMGGLTAATLITLILVPVIYTVFVKDLKWVHWEEKKTDRNQPKRKAA